MNVDNLSEQQLLSAAHSVCNNLEDCGECIVCLSRKEIKKIESIKGRIE